MVSSNFLTRLCASMNNKREAGFYLPSVCRRGGGPFTFICILLWDIE